MHKRFFALLALVVLVGYATSAFAQAVQPQDDARAISRAGAVALLVESNSGLKERLKFHIRASHPMPLFDDVAYDQWYAPYIETAFEAGIITGNDRRMFRPGANVTEEEAIAMSARYHAMSNKDMVGQIQSVDQNWFNNLVMASAANGITLPFPIRLGQPIKRSDLYAMMSSMNISNPSQIAVTYRPAVIVQPEEPVVAAAPTTPRPTTTTPVNRPTTTTPVVRPTTPTPAVTTPRPTTVAQNTPTASAKKFAISMPTLGVNDLTITHPSDPFTKEGLHAPLQYGVGHLFSYPGKPGKMLIYGHSSSYAWDVSNYTKIFRQINKLNVGDAINITYNGKVYSYQVTYKQTVPAGDMSVYQGGGSEELILYTCWPPDSIKERYLVHAKPVAAVAQN